MAIKKTITVDGIEVPFKASAAVPRLYRIKVPQGHLQGLRIAPDLCSGGR